MKRRAVSRRKRAAKTEPTAIVAKTKPRPRRERLEAQHVEVLKAMAVIDCCRYGSDSMLVEKDGRPNIEAALEAAHDILDHVAEALETLAEERP